MSNQDLFIVAQKAFEDGFYDVAIRYIDQLLKEYPQTDKRIKANLLLGQCYFFQSQYLKAFDVFEKLLVHKEYKDATLFWLGETYLKGFHYADAQKHYNQLIELFPDSIYTPQAYYSLGWAYFDQGQYKQARETFKTLIKSYPIHQLSEDAAFKLGETEFNVQDFDKSIAYFQDYLRRFPNSTKQSEAHFYIGEAHYNIENYLEAITFYAKAADQAYDSKLILMSKVSLGWSYLKLQKYKLSEQHFNEALAYSQEKGSLSDDVFLGLANLHTETGEPQKALDAYTQLVELFPNSRRIHESLLGKANTYYMLKKYSNAITTYKELIELLKIKLTAANKNKDQNSTDILEKAYFGLAWSHLKSGKIDQAVTIFQTVKDSTDSDVVKISALTQIGDAYQDAGELEKSIEFYDDILKEYSNSPYTDYVQYRQGIALLKMDKIDTATLSFQSLKANFPESKYLNDINYYLSVAYFKKKEWNIANEYINQFIDGHSGSSEFLAESYYIQGLSNFNLNNYTPAIKSFQKIVRSFPTQSNLIKLAELNIAKCLYNLDDPKEAIKKLKILLFKYPESDIAQEALIWLGDHYLQSAEFEAAEAYYKQFIHQFPGSEKIDLVFFELGQTYEAQSEFDKAIDAYKRVSEKNDREIFAKARLAIADIFSRELDPESAITTYEDILTVSPEFKRDAHIKIAEVHKTTKQHTKVIESYSKALKSKTGLSQIKDAEIQFLIADTYESINNTKRSMEEYLKIPYLYPEEKQLNVKAYLRIARIFEDKEEWDKARIVYKKVIKFETDELKFAKERIEWIKENTP